MSSRWVLMLRALFGGGRLTVPDSVQSLAVGEPSPDMDLEPEGFRERRLHGDNLLAAAQAARAAGEILSVRVAQVVGAEIVVLLGSGAVGGHLYGVMPPSEFDEKVYAGYQGVVGELVDVVVTGYDAGRGVALVSRRQARAIKRSVLLPRLKEGVIVTGLVRSIQPFGAFLDLGGLHAFLPINEISYDFVTHPKDVLHKGQLLKVKVIACRATANKVRVSAKAVVDPWEAVGSLYSKGSIVFGTVSGVQGEHLWVRPQPYHGLEILCPALPDRTYPLGGPLRVKLATVDPLGRRLRGRVIGAPSGATGQDSTAAHG